jgi:hypothetical protein
MKHQYKDENVEYIPYIPDTADNPQISFTKPKAEHYCKTVTPATDAQLFSRHMLYKKKHISEKTYAGAADGNISKPCAECALPEATAAKGSRPVFLPPAREKKRTARLKILVFALFMTVMFFIGILFPLRPSVSEFEKRTLTKFPSFTWESFISGKYFSQIELWYADTFPFRESFIAADNTMQSLYGFRGEQFIGGAVAADDIPAFAGGDDVIDVTPGSTETAAPGTVVDPGDITDISSGDALPVQSGGEPESAGNLYICGNSAYDLYYFKEAESRRYAGLISKAGEQLKNEAQVYSIIIPLSYTINLDKTAQKKMGVSDGAEAISFMYSCMDGVKKVSICNNLLSHHSEYLYFRTDHHWTALGAYYAYEVFCAAKGIKATPLSSYTAVNFDGFLGTFYSASGQAAVLKNNPDTVTAYIPNGTNSIKITQSDGKILNWKIIIDATKYSAANKYLTFIGGDNPVSEIHNPNISDGSSCVVIKESFGNAFVPFLVDSYQDIYIIDARYYKEMTLAQFVRTNGIKDVIFINNLSATGTTARLNELDRLINGN